MTKNWDDPQLDAAQFAIDRFWNAKQTVSEQITEIYQSIRDGTARDEDRKRLKKIFASTTSRLAKKWRM